MKLRYYLRGLGIGMFVTALLMGMTLKGDQSLSDAEIRVRAAELGMVDGDSRTLANIHSSQEADQPSADAASMEEPEDSLSASDSVSASDSPASEPASGTVSAAGSSGSEPVSATPETDSVEPDPLKPLPMTTLKPSVPDLSEPESENTESVVFEVFLGQNSYSVSKALAEAGLVEDADEFDQYLMNNGYSKRIRPGTYDIPPGSTEEEIAKIITRS